MNEHRNTHVKVVRYVEKNDKFPFVEVKMIAHCMKKDKWEKIKDQTYWGHESVENEGFAEVLKCLR